MAREFDENIGSGGNLSIVRSNVPASPGFLDAAVDLYGRHRRDEEAEVEKRHKEMGRNVVMQSQLGWMKKLDDLDAATPNQPGAIQEQGEAYIDELTANMPEELRENFRNKANIELASRVSAANKRAVEQIRVEAQEANREYSSETFSNFKHAARNQYSVDLASRENARKAMDIESDHLNAMLYRKITGPDGIERDLYTVEQRAKYARQLNDISIEEGVIGKMEELGDDMDEFYAKIMNGDVKVEVMRVRKNQKTGEYEDYVQSVRPNDFLSDGGRKLQSRMENLMRDKNRRDVQAEREEEEQEKRQNRMDTVELYDAIEAGTATKEMIDQGWVDGTYGRQEYQMLQKSLDAAENPPLESDDSVLDRLQEDMINDVDIDKKIRLAVAEGQITAEQGIKLKMQNERWVRAREAKVKSALDIRTREIARVEKRMMDDMKQVIKPTFAGMPVERDEENILRELRDEFESRADDPKMTESDIRKLSEDMKERLEIYKVSKESPQIKGFINMLKNPGIPSEAKEALSKKVSLNLAKQLKEGNMSENKYWAQLHLIRNHMQNMNMMMQNQGGE